MNFFWIEISFPTSHLSIYHVFGKATLPFYLISCLTSIQLYCDCPDGPYRQSGKFMLPGLPKTTEAGHYLPPRILIVDPNEHVVDIHVLHCRTPCWCLNPAQIFGQLSTKQSGKLPQCLELVRIYFAWHFLEQTPLNRARTRALAEALQNPVFNSENGAIQ